MRAPAGRNLCTLAEIVRSRLIRKPNTSVESFIAPSPEFEVGFGSELKHSFEHDLAGDFSLVILVKFHFLCLPLFSSVLSFMEESYCVNEFCVFWS